MRNYKNYKIELTTTELQKLSMFLVMYEDELIKSSNAYREICTDYETFSTKQLETFKSNAEWYKETYNVIHELRLRIDSIPF